MTQKWNEVVTLPPTDIASRFYVACFFAGGFLASAFGKGATCRIHFLRRSTQQGSKQPTRTRGFETIPPSDMFLGQKKAPSLSDPSATVAYPLTHSISLVFVPVRPPYSSPATSRLVSRLPKRGGKVGDRPTEGGKGFLGPRIRFCPLLEQTSLFMPARRARFDLKTSRLPHPAAATAPAVQSP